MKKIFNMRVILNGGTGSRVNSVKDLLLLLILLTVFTASNGYASDKIRIAVTTTTFAGIAREITGDKADLYVVASPKQNIHFISPTPRDILKIKKAQVFIHGGLDLESWRAPLLEAAGRLDFMGKDSGRAIDVSEGISLKEIPEELSRIHGDIHAFGNPHYWTDPENGKIIARNIADGLSGIFPEQKDFFQANLENFEKKINEKIREWQNRLAPYQGQGVVIYHDSWPYFMERFRLTTVAFLEPKPGIPPSPRHLQEVIETMKERKVKVIVKEVYHESRTPKRLAEATGAKVITLAQEAGLTHGDYFAMIDENIQKLAEAFS